RKGVAVHVTGDFADPRLPDAVRQWKEDLEKVTSDAAERLTITIAFNYGGQQEIVHAVNALLSAGRTAEVDARQLEGYMWFPARPALDLVIRTSGEQRISNFMIWHAAYAEYYFTCSLWPDFTEKDFIEAIRSF